MNEEKLLKRKQRATRDGNVKQLAEILKELGDFYFEAGRFQDALQEYLEQVEACEVTENKLECAVAHRMIGEVHASMENYEEALVHQNQHLEGARKLENLLEEQRAFATLGRTYFCFAESLTEKPIEREEALKNAKKAYSKSIRLCKKLEGNITERELMMMRARLMLNLGLVREVQKAPEEALEMMESSAELCRKHDLKEDLHRTNLALGAFQERQAHYELALELYEKAANISDFSMKADANLAKAELLLKLGEWHEARKPLVNIYIMKNLSKDVQKQAEKLLRIAVTLCKAEETLLIETSIPTKQKLYENLGDTAVEVKSYDKAIDYYGKMLMCAEECHSEKVVAALVSLAQTLKDAGRYIEALPYARRELQLCSDPREACRSALYLADLMISAGSVESEIRENFNLALSHAQESKDKKLEVSVLRELLDYLENVADIEEAQNVRSKLSKLEEIVEIETDEEEEAKSQNIGEDICLENLSDVEEALNKSEGIHKPKRTLKRGFVIKKNSLGETQLHVACISGNIEMVEKLLAEGHPVHVRDNCGWTPLHEAANHGFVEIARELIKAGADVNDPGGSMCGAVTPLHDAAACGHFSMIYFLLENGANVNTVTESGETVLDSLESWRNRVEGDMSYDSQIEYDFAHEKVQRLTTVNRKNRKKSVVPQRPRWNSLLDEDEGRGEDRRKESKKYEKISAGEDYKRTIANLKHRGGLIGTTVKHSKVQKVTAPLIDSEEILADDWLEEDVATKKRTSCETPLNVKRHFVESTSSINRNRSTDSSVAIKRKSSNEFLKSENESKRQRRLSTESETSIMDLDTNSCESIESNESMFSEFPKKAQKKRTRQLSLLKTGFTKEASRTPSPIFSHISNYAPKQIVPCEVLNFSVLVDHDTYNVTITYFSDRQNVTESLMEEIKNMFEKDTGCKAKLKFMTWEGVELSPETTSSFLMRSGDLIKLRGEIIDMHTPTIVDRYKAISKECKTTVQESTIKCLKVCENTSIFRLNSKETLDEELSPLMKSLQYQKGLQTLHFSGGTLFGHGKLLNLMMQRLPSLYELHLQNCDIDLEVLSEIEKFPQQLRILNLSYNSLGSQSQEKLYNLLQPLNHLQTLNLRYCKLDEFRFTLTNESLENLDISWNALGGDGISRLLQRQMLGLTLSNTQSPCSSNVVSKIINNPRYSLFALETLELSSCKITDADVRRILSETPNLSRFVLGGNKDVTKISVYALLKREPSLFYIDVGGCAEIVDLPSTDVMITNPEVCTFIVSMAENVTDAWEDLWRGKGMANKLPHNVVIFKPM